MAIKINKFWRSRVSFEAKEGKGHLFCSVNQNFYLRQNDSELI